MTIYSEIWNTINYFWFSDPQPSRSTQQPVSIVFVIEQVIDQKTVNRTSIERRYLTSIHTYPMSLHDHLLRTTGLLPSSPLGWLYVARGCFNSKQFRFTIEAAQHCLKNQDTIVQGQQLLSFALYEIGEKDSSQLAFIKSVRLGNESDWQMIVELGLDQQSN